jgi:hypothetical protein
MTPQRIQRKRARGWRMPEGAVYVGRPTVWGNRYIVGEPGTGLGVVATVAEAVEGFRRMWSEPHQLAYIREQLRGKDLACWCRLGQPCHADVLLELANAR